MNIVRGHRKSGRPRKPRSRAEAKLQATEAAVRKQRRHISAKDRKFVFEFIKSEFSDPEGSAIRAGFAKAGSCWRLLDRLKDLIDGERVRQTMGTQMEVEEALRLTAEGARSTSDPKIQVQFLTLVLRANGVLSDKPMPVSNRRQLVREMSELLDQIKRKAGPGGVAKVRAVLKAADGEVLGIEASSGDSADLDPDRSSAIEIASTSTSSPPEASAHDAPSSASGRRP